MEIYSLTLLISIAAKIPVQSLKVIGITTVTLILLSTIYIIPSAIDNIHTYEHLQAQISHNATTIPIKNVPLNPFKRRFIVPVSQCSLGNNIVENKNYILDYYNGKPTTEIIPMQISDMQSNISEWERIYFPSWRMSWIKIPADATIDTVTFLLNPVKEQWKRPFIPYFESLRANEMPTSAYRIITLSDTSTRWLVVYDNPAIASRVKNIRITHN